MQSIWVCRDKATGSDLCTFGVSAQGLWPWGCWEAVECGSVELVGG